MRIGIDGRYITDHFPGIGRYTYNLVRALAELNDDNRFIIFCNQRLSNSRYDLNELVGYANVETRLVDLSPFSLKEQWQWFPLLLRERLDVFHSPYYVKPYLLPCPSVVTIYDTISSRYPEYLPSRSSKVVFDVTTRLASATAKRVITLSNASREDLRRFFNVPLDKIVVAYLAADERYRVEDPAQVESVRAKYRLPGEFILYVGINKPHKNLVTLVEAYNHFRRSGGPAVKLVLAGREDTRFPQARERVAELGLTEEVAFLGDVLEEDLPYLYNCASLFVFPSLYEGFGLPVLEAMACGVPVICSDTSSLPEVVGSAALMVDPLNVEALSGAISEVLSRESLRTDLRKKGLERARLFSWRQTAQETLEVYRRSRRD
ncbi:MAG: glycosyltransferase family 4 protein [Chloroflexi bacterium]|nr:glycosyltransferase family 4 protein [Chloroflexota bacterium]